MNIGISEEERKRVVGLVKVIRRENTTQERNEAFLKLEEWIRAHLNFSPGLLFDLPFSKEDQDMKLILMSIKNRISEALYAERKKATEKPKKSVSESNAIVPMRHERKKGLERLMQIGMVTDRDFNMLYQDLKRGTKIKGDFNYRVKWVHDVFVNRLMKFHYAAMRPFKLAANSFEKEIKEESLAIISKEFVNLRREMPVVTFTDRDFRKDTGLKHLSSDEIYELVAKYEDLKVEGCVARIRDEEKKVIHFIHLKNASYVSVVYETTGRFSPRGHKPEHNYAFTINIGIFFVLQNLVREWITVLPKRFYALRGGTQEIYRHIAQFGRTVRRSIDTISKWLGYKENPSDIYSRRKVIEGYLDELKFNNFLKYWKTQGRGRKTVYIMGQYKK